MTGGRLFEEIYRKYHPKVLGYLRHHIGADDAEDLCGEVFARVWEHLDPKAGTAVSSYIYTITRRAVVDYYRAHRDHAPLGDDLPDEESFEEDLFRRDMLTSLSAALRRLNERERDIIVLHYSRGDTLRDIAAMMELPYGVVKRSHQTALNRLREELEETCVLADNRC